MGLESIITGFGRIIPAELFRKMIMNSGLGYKMDSATDEQILAQIKREKESQYKFLPVTDPLNAINNYMG